MAMHAEVSRFLPLGPSLWTRPVSRMALLRFAPRACLGRHRCRYDIAQVVQPASQRNAFQKDCNYRSTVVVPFRSKRNQRAGSPRLSFTTYVRVGFYVNLVEVCCYNLYRTVVLCCSSTRCNGDGMIVHTTTASGFCCLPLLSVSPLSSVRCASARVVFFQKICVALGRGARGGGSFVSAQFLA